ncbi:MAG: tetratricopeptide repeat protein [Planctomycetota bacterium]
MVQERAEVRLQRARRYSTARALESDLRAFLDHRPVAARPVSALRHWDAVRRLPANFTLNSLELRPAATDAERERNAALLDAAVAEGIDVVSTRAMRAAFRLDEGDPGGAAEDMRRVASEVGTPYARALAEAYEALPADARLVTDLDLGDVPEPRSAMDHYLAGYHALRTFDYAGAGELLSHEGLATVRHAQDLELLLVVSRTGDVQERVFELEAATRGRSAFSAHLLGLSYVFESDWMSTLEVLDTGLALNPYSFPLHENAALAAWRLHQLERAVEHYEVVIDLRPQYMKPHYWLIQVLLDLGEFDAALAVLEQAPFDGEWDTAPDGLVLGSEIESERAAASWIAGDPEAASEAALTALEWFEAARELDELDEVEPTTRIWIAEAIASEDPIAALPSVLARAAQKPTNAIVLDTAARWLASQDQDPDRDSVVMLLDAIVGGLRERILINADAIERRLPRLPSTR